MASYTPGPWQISDRAVVANVHDGQYQFICAPVRGRDPDEAEANTHLIVAAPDMVEALHAARIELGLFVQLGAGPSTARVLESVVVAIAKAEGRP